jgi:DNA modification methylase
VSRIEHLAEGIVLYNADCREILPTLGKVDAVVTSPPYDNLRSYVDQTWSDKVWRPALSMLYKIVKDGGVVVWVVADATINGSETVTSFRQALFAMDCGFLLHDTMIYHREGSPQTHNRYEQKFEFMFVLSKCGLATFNGLRDASLFPGKKRCGGMRQDSDDLTYRNTGGRVGETKLKGNIWTYAVNPTGKADDLARQHPAVFPTQLALDHIISWSNFGETILDPFMGSGTTGVAAVKLGRKFIGIEIEPKYFDIACRRISEALKQPDMFIEAPKPAKQESWHDMWSKPYRAPV